MVHQHLSRNVALDRLVLNLQLLFARLLNCLLIDRRVARCLQRIPKDVVHKIAETGPHFFLHYQLHNQPAGPKIRGTASFGHQIRF